MSRISHQKLFSSLCILVAAVILASPLALFARRHVHYGDGFSIDLNEPYEVVLKVLQSITVDGIVRGTGEYKGTQDLLGAIPVKTSDAFKKAAPDGTVLYKLRGHTIAPDHFDNSNDEGTVTVRYVVKSLGAKSTRLSIDAIFVEDSHHRSHLSDGTVENAEFIAISDDIKSLEDQEAKRRQEAEYGKQQQELSALQAKIESEKSGLKAVTEKQQTLLAQLKQAQPGKAGAVRTDTAVLKAAPYTAAKTIQVLAKGDPLTVLLKTRSWYEVETSGGAKGWIYALMIEVNR